MSLATQIIDQQVAGIVDKYPDVFVNELGLGTDLQKKRSAAFLFLVAKTAFDLTDEEAFDGIVDGGNDFGVDALYLNDLQVVNGGQTVRTVQRVHEEIGSEIEPAEVLVRIYELRQDDNDTVEAITLATNSQNPVTLRDLKANEPRQKDLIRSIAGLGYAYRAKREEGAVSPTSLPARWSPKPCWPSGANGRTRLGSAAGNTSGRCTIRSSTGT